MPSLAISAAVVATVPAASIASSGQSTGNAASNAIASASADDAAGGGAFADVLTRQITNAAMPADTTVAALTTADEPVVAVEDPASQPVDLSLLLQGLLLPNPAANPAVLTGDPKLVASEGSSGRPTQPTLPGAIPDEASIQLAADPGAGLSASDGTALNLAQSIRPDMKLSATEAAIAGKSAESAVRELPLQTGQPEMQTVAHMFAHQSHETTRVEPDSLVVATPVSSPSWHEDLGNKVSMLIGKEATSAELVLTPPHLGRVEVQLTVSGDQTSATFVAATPAARDALEQALPKLREFLADAGINLAQASVGGDAQPGQGNAGGQRSGHSGSGGDGGGAREIVPAAAWTRRVEGMVDTFA